MLYGRAHYASPIRTVTACLLGLLCLVSFASAQSEVEYDFNLNGGSGRTVQGKIVTAPNSNGDGEILLRVDIDSGSGAPWTFPTTYWAIKTIQTHIYVDGRYVQLPTSRAAGTELTGSSYAPHTPYTLGVVLSGISSQTDVSYRSGKFRTVVRINTSNVDMQTYDVEWRLPSWDSVSGGGSGSGGGGVGANDGTVDGQNTFWTNLFVPSEECVNNLVDAASDIANWGPMGLMSDVLEVLDTAETEFGASAEFGVSLDGSNSHGMNVDTSLWDGIIGTVRALMAGVMWVGAMFGAWRLVLKFMS